MSSVPTPPTPEFDRARLEEEGFEALQRLYAEAVSNAAGQGAGCARLLLALYNGRSFPFDLTDLRALPAALFEDAMLTLRMDTRLTRQEVHEYFAAGTAKFEDLTRQYDVQDTVRQQHTGDGAPRPRAERGMLRHQDYARATLVSCGDAPGYRHITLTFDCEVVGEEGKTVGPVRLELSLNPADGVAVMQHVQQVHAFAWRKTRHSWHGQTTLAPRNAPPCSEPVRSVFSSPVGTA